MMSCSWISTLTSSRFGSWMTRPFSSVLGPVPEAAERHDPPPPAEIERMVAARFGLDLELLEGGAS